MSQTMLSTRNDMKSSGGRPSTIALPRATTPEIPMVIKHGVEEDDLLMADSLKMLEFDDPLAIDNAFGWKEEAKQAELRSEGSNSPTPWSNSFQQVGAWDDSSMDDPFERALCNMSPLSIPETGTGNAEVGSFSETGTGNMEVGSWSTSVRHETQEPDARATEGESQEPVTSTFSEPVDPAELGLQDYTRVTEGETQEQDPTRAKCREILDSLQSHHDAWIFNEPVDPVELELPDYFQVVKHPMDLGTIRKKLDSGVYHQRLGKFRQDVLLVFENAILYNPDGHYIHDAAKQMKEEFRVLYESVWDQGQDRFQVLPQRFFYPPPGDIMTEEIDNQADGEFTKRRLDIPFGRGGCHHNNPLKKQLLNDSLHHGLRQEYRSLGTDTAKTEMLNELIRQLYSMGGRFIDEDETQIVTDHKRILVKVRDIVKSPYEKAVGKLKRRRYKKDRPRPAEVAREAVSSRPLKKSRRNKG